MLSSLGVEGYYSAYHRDFFILFLKLGPQSKGSNVIVIKSSMVTTVTHRRLEEQYSRQTRPHWYWATHLPFLPISPWIPLRTLAHKPGSCRRGKEGLHNQRPGSYPLSQEVQRPMAAGIGLIQHFSLIRPWMLASLIRHLQYCQSLFNPYNYISDLTQPPSARV